MATLELQGLTKRFGEFTAVDSMNLKAAEGEMIALLGGSGCGKTTTLRMIAGFTEPTAGQILVDGKNVSTIPPYRRNIGIFFQNYALFPHMTVFENVAFGLKLQKLPKNEIRERVEHMLALVKLTGMDKRYPRQQQRGQFIAEAFSAARRHNAKRVASGKNGVRAIVSEPRLLLLDEPLSNLDAKLRVEMQVEIKRIQKELGITTIIVTHDHEEAVSLADRVIVMNAGHILQIGKPQEVFDRPASPFIADFMGFSTFLHGIAAGAEGDMRLIRCGAHTLQVPAEAAQELTEGDACILAIRSENIRTAEQEGVNTVRGTVKSATYKGHTTRLEVSGCFEEMVYPAIHEYADVQEGSEVLLHFPAQHFCVYKDIK